MFTDRHLGGVAQQRAVRGAAHHREAAAQRRERTDRIERARSQREALFELLQPLRDGECPFTDLPSTRSGHWGEGVTVEDMKVLKWVKPTLVAEIAFTEWTRDGNLRHSAFVGMRADKNARAVVREHSVRSQILEEP